MAGWNLALMRGAGAALGVAAVVSTCSMLLNAKGKDAAEAQTPPTYLNGSWTPTTLPGMKLSIQTSTLSPSSSTLTTVYGASPASPTAPAPSARITTLARALENDPDRIHQFVRNSIAFEPQFGLHKGADGVLLDGAGGAFDQAHLMVSLLRASNIPARYVYGTVTLGPEAASILRVTTASQACYLLAAAGTPATVNGSTACASISGSVSSVVMRHVWVEAQIGSTWYAFDPSLKTNAQITGIDVWGAANTNRTTVWNTVTTGAMSGTTAAGLDGHLTGWATTLENNLAANHHDKSLKQVTGGWEIIRSEANPRNATLPTQASVTARWDNDVPTPFRAKLTVQTAGFSHVFDLPSIYGWRVQAQLQGTQTVVAVRKRDHENAAHEAYFFKGALAMSGDGEQSFACDGVDIVCGAVATSGDPQLRKLTLTIDHPYAAAQTTAGTFADETAVKTVEVGKRTDILVRTGGGSSQRKAKWAAQYDPIQKHRLIPAGSTYECAHPGPNDPPASPGQCDNIAEDYRYWIPTSNYFPGGEVAVAEMGSRKDQLLNTWTDMFDAIIGVVEPLSASRIFHQHSIGVALTSGENSLDINTAVGVASAGVHPPHVVLAALSSMGVTAEAMAVGQMASERRIVQGGSYLGDSAPHRFGAIGGAGLTILQNPGQETGLSSAYPAATKTEIRRYLDAGFDVIVGDQASLSWGNAFMARRDDGSEIAWVIEGASPSGTPVFRKGAEQDRPNPLDHLGKAEGRMLAANVAGAQLGAVDLRMGSLSFSEGTELSFGQGEFPYTLTFSRSYSSTGSVEGVGALGMGWSHNWESSVGRTMDAMALFPDADVVSAAPMLVATLVALESGHSSIGGVAIGGMATDWLQEIVAANVVTVSGGGRSARFVRRADRQTWRNPAAPTEELQLVTGGSWTQVNWTLSDRSVMEFRDVNNPYQYSEQHLSGALKKWTFPTGVVIDLAYQVTSGADPMTNRPVLHSVSNNLGAVITFVHTKNHSQEQTTQCYGQVGPPGSGIGDPQACYEQSRQGGQLLSVHAGPDSVSFGHVLHCPRNTNYCGSQLISAARPGLRTRTYEYGTPIGAGGSGPADYAQVLTKVIDAGVATPRARFVWKAVAGQVAPYVEQAFDAADRPTTYYSSTMTASSAKDATDAVVRQTYDPDGRLIASSDAMNRTARATYDGVGRTKTMQSAWGDVSSFTYDPRSNLIETTRTPISNCASGLTTEQAAWWCQTITVKAEYHTTWNKPTKVTLPATAADPNERHWLMTYNAQGLLDTQTAPQVSNGYGATGTPTWQVWYDAYGRPTKTRDPVGIETVLAYGGTGLQPFCLRSTTQSAQSGGLNLTTTQGCDAVGNVTSVTTPRGYTSTTSYDVLRRKTETLGPSGTNIKTQWHYDEDGRVDWERRWDQNAGVWRQTTTTYTATGKSETVSDPAGDLTRTCYDAVDRPVAVIDGAGRAVKTVYNLAGQPTEVHRWHRKGTSNPCTLLVDLPTGQTESRWRRYEYNSAGLQSAELDARGNAISQQYDGLGRPAKTIFADGSETWVAMDQRGQTILTRQRSGSRAAKFYDHAGRDYQIREFAAADEIYDFKGRNVRAALDLAGRPTWRHVSTQTTTGSTYDTSLIRDLRTYGYDAAGRVTNDNWQPQGAGGISLNLSYAYDADSNRTHIYWPDGQHVQYAYDVAGRPDWVNIGGRWTDWSHGSLGQLLGASNSNNTQTSYGYENDGDLAAFIHHWPNSTTPPTARFDFTYDQAGKIVTQTVDRPQLEWTPPAGYGRTYGVANNLNQTTSEAGVPVTWNTDGNMTSDGLTTFTWTYGNRLIGASRTGMTASYDYDADDRRTKKTVNGVVTYTLWSGTEEVGEYDGSGTLIRRFIPDGSGAMDARSMTVEANGTVYFHHVDRQGSVIATSNASGQVVATAAYSPYGEFASGTTAPPTGSPFGYTGRQYDPETGLYQYRARYYSPRLGVFLSTDPIGTKDDPNLYGYVQQDPVNKLDPTGMCIEWEDATKDNAPSPTEICEDAEDLQLSDAGARHIQASESFESRTYDDNGAAPGGNLTIGYGHKLTPGDGFDRNSTITEDQAQELFFQDAAPIEQAVRDALGPLRVSQQEFDALVDLGFNVGPGVFSRRTSPNLRAAMDRGDYAGMADQLSYTGGPPGTRAGLVARSDARRRLFVDGVYRR